MRPLAPALQAKNGYEPNDTCSVDDWSTDRYPCVMGEIVPAPNVQLSVDLSQEQGLDKIEEELLRDALATLHAAGKFADIEPDQQTPPLAWIEQMGDAEARRALRIARAANLSASSAPIGLTLAKSVALGILAARKSRVESTQGLAIAVIQLPPVTSSYRVMEDKR